MHPDLVAISNIWQCDARIDVLKAEHEGLHRAIKDSEAAVIGADAALTAAQSALTTVKTAERANTRELDDYSQKKKATQQLIDTGTAPDYAVAQRQLASVGVRIDTLENSGLELIDAVESAQRVLREAEAAKVQAASALTAAGAALKARDAPIRKELGEILPRREVAWGALHPELKPQYFDQRRKKKRALVLVIEKACSQCSTFVPPQVWLDTEAGREAHRCTGCGGWILPA